MAKSNTDSPNLDNEARITLGLLNMVHDNASTSQRSMAGDLGIALGLANAYLKRCVKKGLIKVSQAPANRYAYYLTPKGFAQKSLLTAEFLSQSFNLFRHARSEGADMFSLCQNRSWLRVALYGAGDLAEILTLSAKDFSIDLTAVISKEKNVTEVAGLPVLQKIPGTEEIDAVIICDITDPQAAFDTAAAQFPADRIMAPKFLGISKTKNRGGR